MCAESSTNRIILLLSKLYGLADLGLVWVGFVVSALAWVGLGWVGSDLSRVGLDLGQDTSGPT